jgi:nitrogen-specific signal transduction histidine kinase
MAANLSSVVNFRVRRDAWAAFQVLAESRQRSASQELRWLIDQALIDQALMDQALMDQALMDQALMDQVIDQAPLERGES